MNFRGPSEFSYHLFFQDTVNRGDDKLDATLKRRADEALETFDGIITQQREELLNGFKSTLTEQRKKAMTELSQLEKTFVKDLDSMAGKFKDDFIDGLNKSADRIEKDAEELLGDTAGEGSILISNFSRSQIFTFTFAGFLVLTISTLLLKQPSLYTRIILYVSGLTILAAAYISAIYIYQKDFCSSHERLAQMALVNGSLKELYINSIKLEKNQCSPSGAAAYKEASLIGAEMALTPLEISSENGQSLLKGLLSRSLIAQISLMKDGEDRNPSIDAWIAALLWQHGDNRASEFISANYAARAIDGLLNWRSSHKTSARGDSIPLGLVNALSVLDGYLTFPIIEFSQPSIDDAYLRDSLTGGTPKPDALLLNTMPTMLTNNQLQESLNRGMAPLQDERFLDLRAALQRKRLIRKLNHEILERFSRSLFLSTHMRSYPKDQKSARQDYLDQATALANEQQNVLRQTINDLQQYKPTTTEIVFELATTPLELINISYFLPDESSGWVDHGPTIDYMSNPLLEIIDTAVNRGGLTRSRGESLKIFVLRLAYERGLKYQTLLDEARYATVKPGERMKPRNAKLRIRGYCFSREGFEKDKGFRSLAKVSDPTGAPQLQIMWDWELGTLMHEEFVQFSELSRYLSDEFRFGWSIDSCRAKGLWGKRRLDWVGEEATEIIADRQDFIFRNQADDVDKGYFIEARNEHLKQIGLWVCEDKQRPSKKLRCSPNEMGTLWNFMQMHNSGIYFSDATSFLNTWFLPRTNLR